MFEPQHGRPLYRRVPLLHERDQLLEERQFLLRVLLAQDVQQVLDAEAVLAVAVLKRFNKFIA